MSYAVYLWLNQQTESRILLFFWAILLKNLIDSWIYLHGLISENLQDITFQTEYAVNYFQAP